MQNERSADLHGTTAPAIASGQVWQGKKSQTRINITGPDKARCGRWMAVVHSVDSSASFGEDEIRDHYDLLD